MGFKGEGLIALSDFGAEEVRADGFDMCWETGVTTSSRVCREMVEAVRGRIARGRSLSESLRLLFLIGLMNPDAMREGSTGK